MGGLFSCLGGDEADAPTNGGSEKLLGSAYNGEPAPQQLQRGASAPAASPKPAIDTRPIAPPKFSTRRPVPGSTAAPPPERSTALGLFCRCGGPGALVKLQPCGCAALCLTCAQQEVACPSCGTGISDSIPSFRIRA